MTAEGSGVQAIAARRRAARAEAVEAARRYAQAIDHDVPLTVAVVFGSYARGDFNTWSDIDVLLVSDALPVDARARTDMLWRHRPGGIEPVGWTRDEHQARRRRRDPIAVEADDVGVVVLGTLAPPPAEA